MNIFPARVPLLHAHTRSLSLLLLYGTGRFLLRPHENIVTKLGNEGRTIPDVCPVVKQPPYSCVHVLEINTRGSGGKTELVCKLDKNAQSCGFITIQ